jgi:DNA-binding NarL/FixJ family response regulator
LLIAFVIGQLNVSGCKAQNKNLMGHGEKILIIGRHASMLTKIADMLKQNGYIAIGKMTNGDAMLAYKSENIDAVIIGGGVDSDSREYFHREFPKINPKIKIIDAHPQTVLADLKIAFPDHIK